jgi:hypothetical protein
MALEENCLRCFLMKYETVTKEEAGYDELMEEEGME